VLHPTYLPFTEAQLLARFAAVAGGDEDRRRFLRSYEESLERHRQAEALSQLPRQRGGAGEAAIERDERIWTTTALLSLVEGPDPVGDLAALLERAFGTSAPPVPGFATWAEALGPEPELFLEVSLPSPASYQQHLRTELHRHVLSWSQLREARAKVKLEGAARADAVVVSPTTGFAVVLEAEVLGDVSTHTSLDAVRNQLARVIDVTLDANPGLAEPALRRRRPDRTCVVLLTPELTRDDPSSRLYGHLFASYTSRPETLRAHLPHRPGPAVTAASQRLGWASWEDVERVRPGSLPWRVVPGAR